MKKIKYLNICLVIAILISFSIQNDYYAHVIKETFRWILAIILLVAILTVLIITHSKEKLKHEIKNEPTESFNKRNRDLNGRRNKRYEELIKKNSK